ncbi:MAG: electron transfer flavoprotein subunit beta/FixA family protein [Cytophagales bacterium]|nr:electron transfer flavoprotein subunit beta/FixA family protein [Cytophagales bacterium]
MKILICLSHVPDTTARISFIEKDTKLDKEGLPYIIGPYEDYALSWAVDYKAEHPDTEIHVLHVGLSESESILRKALAIGADAAFLLEEDAEDAYQIATHISNHAVDQSYDLILTGRESIETNRGITHYLIGDNLGIPVLCPVMKLSISAKKAIIELEIEGGVAEVEASLPLVLGCQEPIAEWKIPNMRGIMTARSKPLNRIKPSRIDPLVSRQKYEKLAPRKEAQLIDPKNPQELIQKLKEEAKVI